MIKKLDKYQDGGKPKKRVIFVEAPVDTNAYYNSKIEGVDIGTFDTELFRTGRNKLAEELYNIKEQYNLPGKKYSDGDEFVDKIFDLVNNTNDFNVLASYIKDTYKVDLSNNENLKKAFAESTGFPNIVKYGLDNFETVYEDFVDDTFLIEAKKIAKASKEIDNIPTEIVSLYGKDDFERATKKYNKDSLKGADVILLGHSGTKIAGVDNELWNSYLRDNMDSKNTCYGGMCIGRSVADDFKEVPNFTGTVYNKWFGIPEYNSFKGKGSFADIFFGNLENEDEEIKPFKPEYGRDFVNFQRNPELIVRNNYDELGRVIRASDLVELPQQIEPIPTLPTLRTNVSQKDGGKLNYTMKNTKFPIAGSKFKKQQGGYGELQGDAGNLLRDIMGGTTLSGMFDQQTGSYTNMSYQDYLSENKYSKPYPKKDWLGNTTLYVKDQYGNEVKAKDLEKDIDAYNTGKANEFNQNQEQFNKFLPITQNMAGLFDLQQREREEIENKKLRVQDFPTSTSSYAPVGFAQDGGGMNIEETTSPSLEAIMKGLPKGMSKKHKDMVVNSAKREILNKLLGTVEVPQEMNSLPQQTLGYKRNSPYKNLPATNITEIPITEDGGDMEYMKEGGQPKGTNGQVKKSWREGKKLAVYMDGTWHHFGDSSMQDFRQHKSEKRKKAWYDRHAKALKGDDSRSKAFRVYAKKTWEDGGQPKLNVMSNIEKPIRQYRQGGSVFDKDLIANEESKAKNYLNLPPLIPIQTEVKETIVLPDGNLVKTNAKLRHSKMTDNEVTDIVPESSYVLSQFGDTKIYRDEAKQVVLEMKAEPYNIHRASGVPQAKSLGDIMKHNVMSPADLSRVVNNRFKIVEGDDPFLNQTNEANKFNRTAYLQAIIGLSEYDKARKGIDNSISTQMGAQMVAKHGGKVMANYKVPKAVDPVSAVIAGIPALANIGFNIADRITTKKNTRLNDADINRYGETARRNLGLSTMSNALGVALQNPEVTPAIYGTDYLDVMNSNNMAYLNNVSRRATTDTFNNRLDTSSMNPQMAMLLGERDNAMRYEALGKTAADLAKTRGDLFAKYMQMKQATADRNVDNRTSAKNSTQAALNSQVGTLGGIFAGAADTNTNIEANLLDARMANRGNYAANISRLNSSLGQSLQNVANVGLQMYTSDQAAKNADAQNRNSKTIKYQAECQRQGFNWICAPDGVCYCDN